MTTKLDDWLGQHHPEFTAIRRDIHAHPELGLEETRTAALVAAKLNPTTDAIAAPLPRALRPLQPLVAVPRWLLRRSRAKRSSRRDADRV